ncbi:YqjF family protein [Mucilaginibacter sp. AW1-3]
MPKPKFLTAEWNNLLMLNYEVDPELLKPHLPPATELDLWQGKALVSMVGFMFNNTRVLGIRWPFHINFEEVNLRFYVKHFDGKVWKRGAVFISEIVPKIAISLMANNLYNEHYSAMPMRHSITKIDSNHDQYLYEWRSKGRWNKLGAIVSNKFTPIQPGSAEEFIFEHYWGYNKLTANKTLEYAVEHISWNTKEVSNPVFDADIAHFYGEEFVPYLTVKPYSAFFADGSAVVVRIAGKIQT